MVAAAWLTYNRQDLSTQMEGQFIKNGLPANADLFVVDNGSVNPITSSVEILRREENGFFSGGWNWAMEELEKKGYKYVWMMNDDIQGVSHRNIDSMLHIFESHPDALAVTPSFNSTHAIFHPSASLSPAGREVRWIDWCCPMVKISAWKALGGFDERFKGYGADLILCKKARENGFKMFVDDMMIVNHLGSQTANSEAKTEEMCNTNEMDRLLKQHYNVDGWWKLT